MPPNPVIIGVGVGLFSIGISLYVLNKIDRKYSDTNSFLHPNIRRPR